MELVFRTEGEAVLDRLARHAFDAKEWFDLKYRAERLLLSDGFDRLLSLDGIGFEPYEHQRAAAMRVLNVMRGRAILADEVGLGKTIEAGIILKEYMMRSLVRRVLVLVPASLVLQWRRELEDTLQINVRVGRLPEEFASHDRLLASIDTAKGAACRERVLSRKWDMVIVDEAHRLKNRKTVNWRFVNEIQKKYLLLLTATPIQNDLRELYNLVTLLKPGQLKTFSHFKRFYMLDKHSPKNTVSLKESLREVMVRTGRNESLIALPPRRVETIPIRLAPTEREFYVEILEAMRTAFRAMPRAERNVLPLILVLREAASHPVAACRTLRAMQARGTIRTLSVDALHHLETYADRLEPTKVQSLTTLLTKSDEQAVVFTEFRLGQSKIMDALSKAGLGAVAFHGSMTQGEKERAIRRFRDGAQVLVSTESGGEGRNLQFCRRVINYDLPWNPMRVEQRIGRVHRIGQTREVRVTNLVTQHTVDEYVIHLLEKKIGMFERVIGEVDEILARLGTQLDTLIGEAALGSRTDEEMRDRFRALEERIEGALAAYDAVRRRNALLLDHGARGTVEEP